MKRSAAVVLRDLLATLPTCARCTRTATRGFYEARDLCDEHGPHAPEFPHAAFIRESSELSLVCDTSVEFAHLVQTTVATLRKEIAHANLRPSVRALYELGLDALDDRAEQELHVANDNATADPDEYSYGDPPDEETVVEALARVNAFEANDVRTLAGIHEQVSRWSNEERFTAWNWAVHQHRDGDHTPTRPEHIDELCTEDTEA